MAPRRAMDRWVWKMAWRDSKGSRRKLLLFVSSMVVGVAALVAITSFRANLLRSVDEEAQALFGADMSLESSRPFTQETEALIDSIGGQQARRTSFFSVALFPESGGSRLSMVRALEGEYPFYGSIVTEPPEAVNAWRNRTPRAHGPRIDGNVRHRARRFCAAWAVSV